MRKEGGGLISETIRALRESRSWTQAELARKLGVTRNGVNSWEQGLSVPSTACLAELARTFSVSTDYLLGLDCINVSGLDAHDVAVLAELADRLRSG